MDKLYPVKHGVLGTREATACARVKALWDNVATWELRQEKEGRGGGGEMEGKGVERARAVPGSAF